MGSLWEPYSEYIFTLCAFSWSPATFLFSRLPCDQSSSLICPHSMTNQSMPLLWISVGIYLYLLPCKVGNQIYCQRFYPLRGFPSFLPNEAVNQKQSTSNCQPIMQTHLFTRSKFVFFFFFLHQLVIGDTPWGVAGSKDGKAAEANAWGSELPAHTLYTGTNLDKEETSLCQ